MIYSQMDEERLSLKGILPFMPQRDSPLFSLLATLPSTENERESKRP
jgi:hypothetical protein